MPRKPRLPEPLEIEGLSGLPEPVKTFPDDFSDAMIPMAQPTLPKYPIRGGQEIINERKQIDRQRAEAFLSAMQPKPKQVVLVPKGKHIAGTITQKDGTVLYQLKDNPPWRRV